MFCRYRLREVLDEQGRKVNWLAEQTGYRAETISRYLNGATPISRKFALLAATALGVSVEQLQHETPVVAA